MGKPQGIDVSGHNPGIDWQKVKDSAGLSFVFIKATEGVGYVSPEYASQWAGAKAAGLLRGAYHFMRGDTDAAMQAAFFLRAVGSDRGELPLTVDVEAPGDGAGAPVKAAQLRVFVDMVKAQTGKAPIIYTYPAVWKSILDNSKAFTDCPLWIAHYGVQNPTIPGGWAAATFWQYTSRGQVAGVGGIVDQDVFQGTLDQLRQFAGLTAQGSRYFPETQQYVAGGFLDLFNKYGLTIMGYPLSGEYVDNDGYTRQDFENVIAEWREGEQPRIGAAIRRLKYGA